MKHASLEHILNLYHQIYHYADGQSWCDKDYSKFVKIKKDDDDEHGVPFTDGELSALWKSVQDETAEMVLIICYSGWRISEYSDPEVNLKEKYFFGGMKTDSGKNRTNPLHPNPISRAPYDQVWEVTPLQPKRTPHDCRHTFSKLCEKYSVTENDRKCLMGHAFGSDITNRIYGHRELEDLRKEIEKIKVNL